MKTGDKVLISPDLTKLPNWISGTVIEVDNNPFVGIVISAETEDKNVFFGQEDLFKPKNTSVEIELPFMSLISLKDKQRKRG